MFFVLAGALILLRNIGLIDGYDLAALALYFPFLLIAIGVEKIFTGSRLQFISYLSTIAMVIGTLYVTMGDSSALEGADYFSKQTFSRDFDPSVRRLTAELDVGNGELTIRDAADLMVYGRFREWSRKPSISYTIKDKTATVTMKNRSTRPFGYLVRIDSDNPEDWYVSFSREIPLYLTCLGNKANIHLNLSTTPLRELQLHADESEIYLKLGDMLPQVAVDVEGDESMLRLRVPHTSGLRVSGDEHKQLYDRIGLIRRSGGSYVNSGYDTLVNRINVALDDRLQELSIDFY